MSADILRRAAKVLRERAEAAEGPGGIYPETWWGQDSNLWTVWKGGETRCNVGPLPDAHAAYIALLPPTVGLALANHLEAFASVLEEFGPEYADAICPPEAVVMAELIVGEAS